MSTSGVKTFVVPWRRICAALPAVALIGGGIALTAAPARDLTDVAVSNGSAVIVVPDVAITLPARPLPAAPVPAAGVPAVVQPLTPALVLPAGTVPGSSTPVTLDASGIPVRALAGYRQAASLAGAADPGCNLDWALLAAIGRVESDHARFGGNQLDSAGVAQPGIIGIPLDGSGGTALITDSDAGLLDRDTVYDRAVGPMQFIPGTWRSMGTDADGDGVKNPQSMADAAAATAVYLCSGPGDLREPADLHAAIMRYNASEAYVRTVTAIAAAYRQGVTALPAFDLPASDPPVADPPAALSAADRSAPTMALTAASIPTPTKTAAAARRPAAPAAAATPGIPAKPTTGPAATTTPPTGAPTAGAPTTTGPTSEPTTTTGPTTEPTTPAPTTAEPTSDPTTPATTTAEPTTTPAPTTAAPTATQPDPCLPQPSASATPAASPADPATPCPPLTTGGSTFAPTSAP
jgi:Transglycosylase SLT domain